MNLTFRLALYLTLEISRLMCRNGARENFRSNGKVRKEMAEYLRNEEVRYDLSSSNECRLKQLVGHFVGAGCHVWNHLSLNV